MRNRCQATRHSAAATRTRSTQRRQVRIWRGMFRCKHGAFAGVNAVAAMRDAAGPEGEAQ
jgi:hypothetical protein